MAEDVTDRKQEEVDAGTAPGADENGTLGGKADAEAAIDGKADSGQTASEKPPESAEAAAWRDRYARLMADFDNYRKRQMRDRDEVVKRANEALIDELLPVIDHLELAIASAPAADDPFVSGVRIIAEQFVGALAKAGAMPIDATGQPFSHEHHEALGQMPSDTTPAGHVALQLRRGWMLADRLLRPAQVMVSSGPADTVAEAGEENAAEA